MKVGNIQQKYMIRKHTDQDLESIMKVWSSASAIMHPFLDKSFIAKVTSDMRNIYLPGSDTWVYTEDDNILGFVSMIENEIGGLFISPSSQSKGIGTKLVDFVTESHKKIKLKYSKKTD